jgi:DNA-binding response OmpR family regulator
MSARILIIDDEKDLLDLLSINLSAAGYTVRTAQSGAEAISALRRDPPPDLILLDIMLDDISGIKLAGKLKNTPASATIPIIMLTAKDTETDVIVGLSVGADDYITKPFSTAVLQARIDAVLRRANPDNDRIRDVLAAGDIRIFPESQEVRVEGKPVDITAAEYNILLALVEADGAILSRDELKTASGAGKGEKERIIDVHIASLRKKLGPARHTIKTVQGSGYRIRRE